MRRGGSDWLWHWGTGGGNSPSEPRPDWQAAPGVQNEFSNGMRQVPDVAANADPDSGPITVFGGTILRSGGTSASAPFWAGSMLLTNQYLKAQGAAPAGFANPLLYRLASTPQPHPPYHDVVRGGNRLRNCTPGWTTRPVSARRTSGTSRRSPRDAARADASIGAAPSGTGAACVSSSGEGVLQRS